MDTTGQALWGSTILPFALLAFHLFQYTKKGEFLLYCKLAIIQKIMANWKDIFQVKKQSIELDLKESEFFLGNFWSKLSKLFRVTFIIFILLIIPGYFLAKLAGQKIGDSYFKKDLISSHASFNNPTPLSPEKVRILNLGNNEFAAYSQVTNSNLDLSAGTANYKFSFYSTTGRLVQAIPGKTFFLPNQKKYIMVPRLESVEPIGSGNLEFSKMTWQKKLSIPEVHLSTTPPNLYEQSEPAAFVAEGSVLNDSPYSLSTVRLTFLLYGQTGQIIAVSQRDEFNLPPFGRRAYKQFWNNFDSNSVTRAQIFAETNTLDSKNLTLQNFETSPSSNLSR